MSSATTNHRVAAPTARCVRKHAERVCRRCAFRQVGLAHQFRDLNFGGVTKASHSRMSSITY